MQNLIALGGNISHSADASTRDFGPGSKPIEAALGGDCGDGSSGVTEQHDVGLLLLLHGPDAEVASQQAPH
jgi:hypothetical protein